jgi:serine/threonine protein kinase
VKRWLYFTALTGALLSKGIYMNSMIGNEILHYKIIKKLGEGGMGVVYKAEDTKLSREVAIKILPPHLLVTEDDRSRFNREAKAAAALNHSNIATVYEINESDEKPFIVMEYVEGQTLNHIIEKAPLKLTDAISITIQIAEGLQAAHKKDIVHRDIKASNILLSTEKQAKILDFGLAKTSMSTKLTQMGTTIGTVAYMSPEQVRGEEVDHRTDLWSLGVLLYELIAGRLPYKAEYDQAIFYSIQNENPDPLTTIRTGVPMALEWIVEKLMAKDPNERYQSANDLIIDLKAVDLNSSGFSRISKTVTQNAPVKSALSKTNRSGMSSKIFVQVSIVILVALAAGFLGRNLKPQEEKRVRKFEWPEEYERIEISPDGRKLAYTQNKNFWIRSFDSFEPATIENDAVVPPPLLWSPDSRHLAYYINSGENRQLRKASANGGQSVLIANFPGTYTPCFWGVDDSLVFVENNNTFYKMSVNGSTLKKMYQGDTTLCKVQSGLQTAYRLPGKDAMVLTVNSTEKNEIIVQNENMRKTIYSYPQEYDIAEAIYSNTGHILFHRWATGRVDQPDLWAIPIDLSSFQTTGEPFLVTANAGYPDVTEDGTLFYGKQKKNTVSERLVIMARNGVVLDSIGQRQQSINSPNISPDGTQVVVGGNDGNDAGIWLQKMNNKKTLILQDDASRPTFSNDGKYLYYSIYNSEQNSQIIYKQRINGLGEPERINNTDYVQYVPYLSESNRYILITGRKTKESSLDIFYQENGGTEVKDLLTAAHNEVIPSLSPDERFMVFESDKNGQYEIYLTQFPDTRLQRQVSINGGMHPQWIGDEIFFVTPENELMVVTVEFSDTEISINTPQLLFSGDQAGVRLFRNYNRKYTVMPDGKSIIAVHSPQSTEDFMVLVENWYEEFRDKN